MGLPERIKLVRDELGLSQKEMAKALVMSLPSLQNYEAGKSVPGGNVFESLVKIGFNANWLLSGEGKMWREGFGPEIDRMVAAADRISAINDMLTGGAKKPVDSGVMLDFALLEKIIVDVIKFQRLGSMGPGEVDEAFSLVIEVLARQTASTIINSYKTCIDQPTIPAEKIIKNFNSMIGDLTEKLNDLARKREKGKLEG